MYMYVLSFVEGEKITEVTSVSPSTMLSSSCFLCFLWLPQLLVYTSS